MIGDSGLVGGLGLETVDEGPGVLGKGVEESVDGVVVPWDEVLGAGGDEDGLEFSDGPESFGLAGGVSGSLWVSGLEFGDLGGKGLGVIVPQVVSVDAVESFDFEGG